MTSSKNLRETVANSEKYHRLFQFFPDAISLTRASDGILLDANGAFEQLTGYRREEIIGRKTAHLGCWLDPVSWEEVSKALEATGEVRDLDTRLQCKDGRLASILLTLRLLEMEGEPCYLAVVRDITDRKRAEEKAREREDELRSKLDTLLSPDIDISGDDIRRIIDFQAIQELMNSFYKLTKIGMALIDLKGNILVATGWQDICTKFHRMHPQTLANCIESDIILSRNGEGDRRIYKCKNNMWDMAIPITVGGEYIASVFLGQFLFEDEVPDRETFARQAETYGFDKEEYLAALERVPRWSRETIHNVMEFYTCFASMIAELSYRNIRLARVLGERKRAEEALKVLAAEKSVILNSTIDLVLYHDKDMRILWMNREACDSAGMQPEELVGRHCWEIWHQRTEACSGCPVIAAFDTGEPQEAEIRSSDGRQWHIRGFPVRDDEGKVMGVTEFCLDITERKRMEQALRESEVNFATVFRATPSVLVISTLAEGRYIEVNETFERVIGYRREEAIGRTSLELDIWEDPKARTRFIRLLQERGKVRDLEARFRSKTGEIFVGLVSAEVIEMKGEARLLILVNDITARKRAEEALGESEGRYRTLFEGASDAILTIHDGLIVNCNNKALELFRSTPEEFIGKSPEQFSPLLQPDGGDSAAKAREKMGQVAAGPPQFFQWRHRRGDGTLFDAEVSLNRLEYQGKTELIAILRDVTERRRAEEQNRRFNEMLERRVAERTAELEEINRELESFCYTISHDLRAPLRAIDGFTHILGEDHEANFSAEGRQLCRRISGSAVRMGEMIDDLLNFSRIGRAALQADPIEMTDLVRAVFDEVVPEEARRRIEFRLAPLPPAIGDRATLRQVWANLIGNAVKYSSNRPGPVIEIGGEQTETETVFQVRDNGVGFDMAYADKLFGVFQRLHGAREFSGTGVGLAIVGRIVQRHGGRVWAEGAVDRGATLYFSLPLPSSRR